MFSTLFLFQKIPVHTAQRLRCSAVDERSGIRTPCAWIPVHTAQRLTFGVPYESEVRKERKEKEKIEKD